MAKFVRKLNRDESGYHYEEIKSNVTPKKKPKGMSNLRAFLSGFKSSSKNSSVLKDAIADAKSIRNTALENAKDRMESSFITGVSEVESPWYVPSRGGMPNVTYDERHNTYTVNGHRFTAEAFADLHHSGDIGYAASPANMEPMVSTGYCGVKGADGAKGDDVEYYMSGSISVSMDDSSFPSTASCVGEINNYINSFHNIDTQPVIDMITTKKYRENGGERLRKLAGIPLKLNTPNFHGKIVIK